MTDLYFTPIEVSRLIGLDKRGLFNKRKSGVVKTSLDFRRGRRNQVPEVLYKFEEVVKLCPEFEHDHESRIFSMFQLRTGPYAFKLMEACRLAGVSHQWVLKLIKQGKIERILGMRKLRIASENLIRLSELTKLFNGKIGRIINRIHSEPQTDINLSPELHKIAFDRPHQEKSRIKDRQFDFQLLEGATTL